MSFDGDNLSRYYSAMSGPPNPVGRLRALVRTYPSALVAYSGGVDSALLAVVLRQEVGRERMVAGVGRSASYPAAQWATARAVAQRFDVPLVELDTHELEDPDYLANPTNRCFFCKTELWRRLVPAARRDGRSAGPPPWRPGGRAHRGRTALGSLGYRAAAGNQGTPHRLGLRGGRGRSPRLPPRRSPRRARVRLFVALNLPAPVREALWAATARARDLGLPVKWVRGEGLHLTLKFLG